MTLIVDRTATHHGHETERTVTEREPGDRRRIDVSDLDIEGIEAFVTSSLDTDHVSLEQRGAQTYLRVES